MSGGAGNMWCLLGECVSAWIFAVSLKLDQPVSGRHVGQVGEAGMQVGEAGMQTGVPSGQRGHRIIVLFWLEEAFKMIKSNHYPSSDKSLLNHVLQRHIYTAFRYFQG